MTDTDQKTKIKSKKIKEMDSFEVTDKVATQIIKSDEAKKYYGMITSDVVENHPIYLKKSFGNVTVRENFRRANTAILAVQREHKKYGRRNSQWTLKNLTLSWDTPSRNLRQISAEVKKKEEALFEHKYKHKTNMIKVLTWEKKLKDLKKKPMNHDNNLARLRLELKVEKEKVGFQRGLEYIEGALKDILILKKCYDDIVKKHGLQTEKDFEVWEQKHHIMRSIRQCIRDVRQTGKITKGEQEFIEQWGGNPSYMYKKITEYVNKEYNSDDPSGTMLNEFVNEMADEHKDLNRKQLEYHGFNPDEQIDESLLRSEAKKQEEKTKEASESNQ